MGNGKYLFDQVDGIRVGRGGPEKCEMGRSTRSWHGEMGVGGRR